MGSPYFSDTAVISAASFAVGTGSSSASAIFSQTVSVSNKEKCWNTMPMPIRRACEGAAMVSYWPFHMMVPASGLVTP